jgi:hypothetical protein
MDKRIEKYWAEKYPDLFKWWFKSPREMPMGRGFECANGWFEIMDPLWAKLATFDGLEIHQCKEKFGGLTIYTNFGYQKSKRVELLISRAYSDSMKTCMMCGKSGERKAGTWARVLCPDCEKEKDPWAITEQIGSEIAKRLGLRTTCKTKEDHFHTAVFDSCYICGAKYDLKTGEWHEV